MKEPDYSNREINSMFKDIKETLGRIESQTVKTNGRVSNLETWREGLMGKIIGAGAVLGFIWSVIINKLL